MVTHPSLPVQPWPVLLGLVDVLRNRFRPGLLHGLAVVEIELALDDGPRLGIDGSRMALADPISAIAAIQRSVLFRQCRELVAVGGAGKPPGRSHPLMR